MASVTSPLRNFVKPVISGIFGDRAYKWFLLYGKVRDIRRKLVEEPEMALLPKIIGEGDRVIDVGANYAYYTTRMAALCPKGRVYAFEPIPSTHWVCRQIVKLFRLRNVELHQLGVSDRDAQVTFEIPLQRAGTPSAGQAHIHGRNNDQPGRDGYYPFERSRTAECRVTALGSDEWRKRLGPVRFVKIDIEGAELFALRGMRPLLDEHAPVVLLEVCEFFLRGFGLTGSDLREFAGQAGYDFYRYEPDDGNLIPHPGEFRDGNYLMLPRRRMQELAGLLAGKDAR